jgi:type I restriction-modification system DNA methylase subunit
MKNGEFGIEFERIVELINKYNRLKQSGELRKYNEELTKKDFILPLFEALGWNVYNRSKKNNSVSAEEKISKGRVDYGFRINDIPKFFLEAKSLKEENIHINGKHLSQAIDYAWFKSCSWAILTNFETIAIINADVRESNFANNIFFVLHPDDFLTDERLTYLTMNSFSNGDLDKLGSKYGKKQFKKPIDKQLLEDMIHFREILSKSIASNNGEKHLSQDDLDESVQRILDRLIFIRNSEDRELEENQLQSKSRIWTLKGKGNLIREISRIYKEYDNNYNSKLFANHLCDDLDIDDTTLLEVLEGLNHAKDNSYRYDFSLIESDVLGGIYEQYLGNILKKTPKRARLEESKTHRKEQGIYYTPSYIVDYIVKNTVGEYIRTHTPEEIRNVKILDPSCGSGSFLIKAYKELENYWNNYYKTNKQIPKAIRNISQSKFETVSDSDSSEFYSVKSEILMNNIFGIDLDPKAVEIAQLNLLLQVSERKQRLPLLQNNIKIGNSLIDDLNTSDRAFKWEDEFPNIMKNGGFDVIIGNPPYVRIQNLNKNEVEFFNRNYYSPEKNYDIYILFIERGFEKLRENGRLGLILPHKFIEGENGKKIRNLISKYKAIERIIHFGSNQVFEGATTYTCLLFLRKKSNETFLYKEFKLGENFRTLESTTFEEKRMELLNTDPWNFSTKQISKILTKMVLTGIRFDELANKIFKGSSTGNDEIFLMKLVKKGETTSIVYSTFLNREVEIENKMLKPFVYGEDIKRYQEPISNKMLLFPYQFKQDKMSLIPLKQIMVKFPKGFYYLNETKNELLKRKVKMTNDEYYKYSAARSLSEYEKQKIMIPDMLVRNRIGYDQKGVFYHGPAVHSVLFKESENFIDPLYYLAILNSKIFWFFITQTSTTLRGNTYRLTPEFLNPFPFPSIDITNSNNLDKYQNIILLAKNIVALNTELLELRNKETDQFHNIKLQITKIENDIDRSVYSLYGLSETEIELIEGSI